MLGIWSTLRAVPVIHYVLQFVLFEGKFAQVLQVFCRRRLVLVRQCLVSWLRPQCMILQVETKRKASSYETVDDTLH